MKDVCIVGGGPAGATAAILLGRAGLTVDLFDQQTFPREKACGEGIMPAGVAILQRIGLLEFVNGKPFYGICYHIQNTSAKGYFPKIDGMPIYGICQRRFHIDKSLIDIASSTPNVEVHTGNRVQAPHIDREGRVIGVVTKKSIHLSQIVIAADGLHSQMRKSLGLDIPVHKQRVGFRTHYKLAFEQDTPAFVDVFVGENYEIYTGSLPNREMLLSIATRKGELKNPVDEQIKIWVKEHPLLEERLRKAEQITSIKGVFPLHARARSGILPGVVLLGDAAGFIDPITGGGLTQALLSAELLAKHLPKSLSHNNVYLKEFDRERNILLRDYRFVTSMALRLSSVFWLSKIAISGLYRFPRIFSHLIGVAGGMQKLLPHY